MKKELLSRLHSALSQFKWYRKRKGGKWFLVYEKEGYNTIDGASMYWTQAPSEKAEVVKEDDYSGKQMKRA